MKTKFNENYVVVNVQFERLMDEEEKQLLKDNFKSGLMKSNPDLDLNRAIREQLALELQDACDNGFLMGQFDCVSVESNQCFDYDMKVI